MPKRPLPSITALQSFEAVARYLSATRAAQELFLTQSAVSKQVAQLEETLKNPLFTRIRKRLKLTPAGEMYLIEVRKILNQVEMSSRYIQSYGGNTEVLTVSAPPTFAAKWLIPRLVGFGRKHPNIHLDIRGELGSAAPQNNNVDVEFFADSGARPGAACLRLFDEEVIAVCSPEFLTAGMPNSLQQLVDLRLLQLNSRPQAWHDWFEAQEWNSKGSYHGPRFETFHMLISAALCGCGVALVPSFLILDELAQGRLVTAWAYTQGAERSYYLSYPEHTAGVPKIQALAQWVEDHMDDEGQSVENARSDLIGNQDRSIRPAPTSASPRVPAYR